MQSKVFIIFFAKIRKWEKMLELNRATIPKKNLKNKNNTINIP